MSNDAVTNQRKQRNTIAYLKHALDVLKEDAEVVLLFFEPTSNKFGFLTNAEATRSVKIIEEADKVLTTGDLSAAVDALKTS